MREDTVRSYANDAGFTNGEMVPIENGFWRFSLMTP
jgi:hypothetical protein